MIEINRRELIGKAFELDMIDWLDAIGAADGKHIYQATDDSYMLYIKSLLPVYRRDLDKAARLDGYDMDLIEINGVWYFEVWHD